MRIAVIGTGAVGGYFGAKLATAGHELVFIARGQQLEALRRAGLRVVSPSGNWHVRNAAFTASADAVENVDLVLFCVKSYDTETAAKAFAPLIGVRTTILSLQNGIDNPEKLAGLWGDDRVLAGVVYIGAQVAAPGVIHHANGGKIVFGRLHGKANEAAKAVERVLSAAEIPCELSDNIQKIQWAKLLWNAPFCAISCLARANVKQIVESDALTRLAIACMTEVRGAALTCGIDLRRSLFHDTIAFSRGLGEFKPSMLQDLEARKPLEYEAFNGIVVKLLRQAGQTAPINQTFYTLLQHLDKKSREEAAS
jgi:2-dehydropantoate 2-reductase